MKHEIKNLVRSSILVAVALVLSAAEKFFPLSAAVPLPGVKLGLANIVTMYAIFNLSIQAAVAITISRCILTSIFMGSPTSLIFSLTGAAFAIIIMFLLKKGYIRYFSLLGISICGALAHNLGQIIAASFLLRSPAVFSYLPVLTYIGLFTGTFTAIVVGSFFNRVSKYIRQDRMI